MRLFIAAIATVATLLVASQVDAAGQRHSPFGELGVYQLQKSLSLQSTYGLRGRERF